MDFSDNRKMDSTDTFCNFRAEFSWNTAVKPL